MKKWAIPLAAAALVAVIAVAGAAFALSDSGGDDGPAVSRDTDDGEAGGDGTGNGIDATCLEGAIDCDDTIDTPVDPGVCIQIFPTPPECANPDEPVSDEPASPPGKPCSINGDNATCQEIAVALAREDLAGRLGSAAGVTVESVEFVEWPDSCLGISKTDVACAEVITPGYRIVLEADGRRYEYHTASGSRAVLVE